MTSYIYMTKRQDGSAFGHLLKHQAYAILRTMKTWRRLTYLGFVVILVAACVVTVPAMAYTKNDLNEINAKIDNLEDQIQTYENQASSLAAQADSLENQIAIMQNEQATLQAQIDLKQAEHDQIVADIAVIQERINDNSETIGHVVAQYYYNNDVSTVERLASSNSFSSYVDEEVHLSSMTDTLSDVIKENNNLKAEMTQKKKDAELILADLSTQKQQLEAKKVEQATLLAETRNNESSYRQLKASASSEKAKLEDQQADIIAALFPKNTNISAGDPNKGGYPYSGKCPAAKLNGTQYSDPWGMYICECVSYAAWRVYHAYGYMPYWGGRGNAKQWPSNAQAAGYTVNHTPTAGSVGIITSGAYGHAVWVEAVNSDGTINISQYNYRINGIRGQYSEMKNVSPGVYQYFIHFR